MKIANWNLERIKPSEPRLALIQEYVVAVDADIWILTETHENVGPEGEFSSCFSGEPDRVSRAGERWVGIWSRWPIESLHTFVSDSSRCCAGRIATSPYGELIIYGGVLPWTNDWRGFPGVNGQAFEAALSIQRDDWMRIQLNFPNATLIVAGDFNQDLAARHYYGSKRKRSLLENALRGCNVRPLTAGVNDPVGRDSPPYACIDHICMASNMEWDLTATTRWPDSPTPLLPISDHFGVSVELVPHRSADMALKMSPGS